MYISVRLILIQLKYYTKVYERKKKSPLQPSASLHGVQCFYQRTYFEPRKSFILVHADVYSVSSCGVTFEARIKSNESLDTFKDAETVRWHEISCQISVISEITRAQASCPFI